MIFLIKEKKVRKSCQSRLLYNNILVYLFSTLLRHFCISEGYRSVE